ncbi:hypothetical protein MauCBS54593_007847 [Microsporum audouinii]
MPESAKDKDIESDEEEEVFHDARFPPGEEAELLSQSHNHKAAANTLFASSCYSEAISTYDRALSVCPNYLEFERAVLQSNIAACHLKLEDWKAAIEAATSSISCLDRIIPIEPRVTSSPRMNKVSNGTASDTTLEEHRSAAQVVELPEDASLELEDEALNQLKENDTRREDMMRIRAKSLMRRAKGRMELGGWANLQGAEEDYRALLEFGNLPSHDQRVVRTALRQLPAKINEAKGKEMAEMMGKLKDLGNGILKPFGLSTDNFKFVKDEKTGGYSMAFEK